MLVCLTKEASATTSNWVISVSNCVFFANIASAVVSISPFLVRILSATPSKVVIKVSTLVSFTREASATTSN